MTGTADAPAICLRFFETTRVVYAGIVDRSGRVVIVSNAALEGVGATLDEVVGKPFWESRWFSHREDSQAAARQLLETALKGEIARADIWNRTAEGGEILVRASAEPGYGPGGEISEILVSGFDDTPRWRAVEKQTLILRESDHRMKNILTIIQAVARLSARSSERREDFLEAFDKRLMSLAASHDLARSEGGEEVDIAALARTQLAPFAADDWAQITFRGPRLALPAAQAQALGLVIHEFATNAVKFGALSRRGGRVEIAWSGVDEGGMTTLTWTESGGPEVPRDRRTGFGTGFVTALLAPMSGDHPPELQFPPEGFRARLRLHIAG